MGTPHRGADLAAWATTATRLAKAIGKAGNEDIVSSLKSGSPTLESLQDSFAGIQGRFNIHTVLEAQSMHGIGKVDALSLLRTFIAKSLAGRRRLSRPAWLRERAMYPYLRRS